MFAYLRQSTASQSRLVGPFIDDTDFKTVETALTIANTDVKLSKNGGVASNKNSGGGTHRANGMYSLTFDATDTSTVGELTGCVLISGALLVTFKFWVLEEAIYDSLFGANAKGFSASQRVDVGSWVSNTVTHGVGGPNVNVNAISGDTSAADNLEADYDGTGYNKSASTIGTCTTNTDMLTAAAVNAEVLDVLNTDTFAEISAVPSATTTITNMIRLMYSATRNKTTQTASTYTIRNDADSADIASATVSDDGTTATKGKLT